MADTNLTGKTYSELTPITSPNNSALIAIDNGGIELNTVSVENLLAGSSGGTNVLVDNTTIVKNSSDIITAIGVKTKNDVIKYDWMGTSDEYLIAKEGGIIEDEWVCYITDDVDSNIYTGFSIGTVFYSQSSKATDNPGALPLWTGEYFETGKSLYPDFYNWVKQHPELCKTKTEYDTAISTYGECPYYVVDEVEGSLRLPKLTNYIKMANATNGITPEEAGLPNIKVYNATSFAGDLQNVPETVRKVTNTEGYTLLYGTGAGTPTEAQYPEFDASLSSDIYGNSDTVTPAHTTLYPWVCAYNAAVEASVAQAAEFTGALTGKADADLANIPSNYDYVVESYTDPTTGSWYRLYKSGWLEQGCSYDTAINIEQITFLKPFSSTPIVLTSTQSHTRTSYNQFNIDVYNLSSTGFTKQCSNAVGRGWGWEAKGYDAGKGAE